MVLRYNRIQTQTHWVDIQIIIAALSYSGPPELSLRSKLMFTTVILHLYSTFYLLTCSMFLDVIYNLYINPVCLCLDSVITEHHSESTRDLPVTLQSNELVFPVATSQLLSNTELLQIRQCADHVHHMSAC